MVGLYHINSTQILIQASTIQNDFRSFLVALFASISLAVPAVTVNEAAAIFDREVNAGRPIVQGACCIAGKNKKGDKCENNGKAVVCAVADTAGYTFPLLPETTAPWNH